MKNNLLGKQLTALVIGSLMILSGQALAIKSNNHKIIDAEALNNSKIIIAQESIEACAQVKFGVAILDQIITKIKQGLEIQPRGEIPPEVRDQIESYLIKSLREAINAFAMAQGIAEKDKKKELVITLTTVISVLENVAQAIASGAGEVSQLEQLLEVLKRVKAEAEQACQF